MGIGYTDSIILYNRYENAMTEQTQFFGTRFDNVRIELTQGANIRNSGLENADSCVVKIPNKDLPKPYISPEVWNDLTAEEMENNFTIDTDNENYFIIFKKPELSVDLSALPEEQQPPTGIVTKRNFIDYLRATFGNVYRVNTLDVYTLIPRFEIGGQ